MPDTKLNAHGGFTPAAVVSRIRYLPDRYSSSSHEVQGRSRGTGLVLTVISQCSMEFEKNKNISKKNKIFLFWGIVLFQRLISCCIERPSSASPAPFGGGGTCDSSVEAVYLIRGYTTPSQPGRHSGGAEPLERPAFLVL
jgi:hypothetical protein